MYEFEGDLVFGSFLNLVKVYHTLYVQYVNIVNSRSQCSKLNRFKVFPQIVANVINLNGFFKIGVFKVNHIKTCCCCCCCLPQLVRLFSPGFLGLKSLTP